MKIRLATLQDLPQLIQMRWDFSIEFGYRPDQSYESFVKECEEFLHEALLSKRWFIWIAEENALVVAHTYIQLIDKVPRPGRVTKPFGYVTNVYTKPEYRNKRIGSQMQKFINQWAKDAQLEFLIVWPSEKSIQFYERNGYQKSLTAFEQHF